MSDFLTLILQQSINGVYLGCLYVLVALGLTLIYGVMNQINFAHADFVTVGAFTAFFGATRFATKWLGMSDTTGYLLSIFLALGAGAILGFPATPTRRWWRSAGATRRRGCAMARTPPR